MHPAPLRLAPLHLAPLHLAPLRLAPLRLALLALALVLTLLPAPARAACAGRDLIAAMDPAARADFDARLAAVPYSEGLIWRATRGDAEIRMVGTYHFADPRQFAVLERVGPLMQGAARVLVEATGAEEAALKRALAERPDFLFITDGPTIPEMLPEADWQALRAAMRARAVPDLLAAKLRPWFVAAQLALPPCMARAAEERRRGVDWWIMLMAEARGLPVDALEPFDTLFRIFEDLPEGGEAAMIRTALVMEAAAEDMAETLAAAYFAERPWAIWQFTRDMAAAMPGVDPAEIEVQIRLAEGAMMARRNRAWIPVLTAAAEGGPVLAAFGALHLPGPEGVLALLAAEGFSVDRLR
jgi:uncharacterized protein YbaP (TraB family)